MAESGGIWIADAEENNTDEWTGGLTEEGSNTFTVTEAAAIHGTYGFQLDFDGTNNDCYGEFDFITPQTNVYIRFNLNLAVLATGGSGDMDIFRCADSGVGTAIQARIFERANNKWGLNVWVNNGATFILNNSGSDIFTEATEYYIEFHYIQHASNGGAEVWVDGVEKASVLNLNTSGYNVDVLRVGSHFRSVPSAASIIYIDDVKADNSYIGAYSAAGTTISVVASDGIVLDESAGRVATYRVSASDGLALNDSDAGLASLLASASDSINLDDNVSGLLSLLASATDSITLDDTSTRTVTYQVASVDGITLGDTSTVTFKLLVTAADGIVLDDAASVTITLAASALDGIVVNDTATSLLLLLASALDGITLQDISTAALPSDITGKLSITFSTKKSTITFTIKKPSVAFAEKKPSITVTGV